MEDSAPRHRPAEAPIDGDAVSWSSLRARVQRYLERQGVPAMQAERFSHEIVVMCASEAERMGPHRLMERAMSEADTVLVGWQAARREALLAAA